MITCYFQSSHIAFQPMCRLIIIRSTWYDVKFDEHNLLYRNIKYMFSGHWPCFMILSIKPICNKMPAITGIYSHKNVIIVCHDKCTQRRPHSKRVDAARVSMMTSSNENILLVTGPLCGEFTGPGEFPTQRPVTRSFYVFFDLHLN